MLFVMLQAIEDDADRDRLANFYLQNYGLLKVKAEFILDQFGIGNRNNLTEDMIHDAMAKMIQNIDTVAKLSDPQLLAYGVKAVQSCTTDYCRKMLSQQRSMEAKAVLEGAAEDQVWEDQIDLFAEESPLLCLGKILTALPSKDREVLIYKYFLKYSDKKTAELLDIQEASVRMALTRARKKVRSTWAKMQGEERE